MKKKTRAGAAGVDETSQIAERDEQRDELLEELRALRAQMQAHTELLALIACAVARSAQITHAEHKLQYPTGGIAASRDTLGLMLRVETALKRMAVDDAFGAAGPAKADTDG